MKFIYLWKNKINKKLYIGRNKTKKDLQGIFDRYKREMKKGKRVINIAMRKYGIENFELTAIQRCYTDKSLEAAKKKLAKKYNSYVPNGYNVFPCGALGGSPKGIYNKNYKRPKTKEHRNAIRNGLKGKPKSEQHRKNISNGMKGKKGNHTGHKHTPESLKKMSESLKRAFKARRMK